MEGCYNLKCWTYLIRKVKCLQNPKNFYSFVKEGKNVKIFNITNTTKSFKSQWPDLLNQLLVSSTCAGLGITHQASLWSHCRWRLWRFQQYTMLRTMKIIQGCTLYQRFQLHRTSVSAKNSMVHVTLHRNFGFFFSSPP